MDRGRIPDDLDRAIDEIQEVIIDDARKNYSEKTRSSLKSGDPAMVPPRALLYLSKLL